MKAVEEQNVSVDEPSDEVLEQFLSKLSGNDVQLQIQEVLTLSELLIQKTIDIICPHFCSLIIVKTISKERL